MRNGALGILRSLMCAKCGAAHQAKRADAFCNSCKRAGRLNAQWVWRSRHGDKKNADERERYHRLAARLGHPPKKPRKASWVKAWSRARRARKSESIGTLTERDFAIIVKRQHGRCFDCHSHMDSPTVGHLIPLCRGGSNGPWNIVAQCKSCNSKQGTKVHPEAEPTLFDRPGNTLYAQLPHIKQAIANALGK